MLQNQAPDPVLGITELRANCELSCPLRVHTELRVTGAGSPVLYQDPRHLKSHRSGKEEGSPRKEMQTSEGRESSVQKLSPSFMGSSGVQGSVGLGVWV